MEPKSSQIDIVQAVGRVMRTAKGKPVGTIVIPVFIDTNDDPDVVLKDSAFDTVWQVIKAIRSHDEEIAEILDQLRRESGRTGTSITRDDFGDKIIFDLPAAVNVDFSSKLSTRIVELTTSSWEYGLGKLIKFIDRVGNALVPHNYVEDDFNLGSWVSHRRTEYGRGGRGKLTQLQIDELNELGFVWDRLQHAWDEGVSYLKQYIDRVGNALVPGKHIEDDFNLGRWVKTRRMEYGRGKLTQLQIDELNELGFVWDVLQHAWDERVSYLKQYIDRVGNALVPARHIEDDFNLGSWVSSRRMEYGRGKLTQLQIDELNELGFVWDARSKP
jgi:hypothetical protein